MATGSTPAKIILKNSTKISLNDRFTTIMKTRPVSAATVRANLATERMASEKNRRLAQQMERRPSVAAALGPPDKPSMQERLGNRPARGMTGFSRGRGRGFPGRGRASMTTRLGRAPNQPMRGNAFTRRGYGSPRSQRGGRGRGFKQNNPFGRGGNRGRSMRGGRGSMRGGRGSMRGGRGGQRGKPQSKDRNSLDQELDQYMSKTKGSMDAELDTYMAEVENK